MDNEILLQFKDNLVEIIYDGKFESPNVIKGIFIGTNSNGIFVKTRSYIYFIPFSSIKDIRMSLKR